MIRPAALLLVVAVLAGLATPVQPVVKIVRAPAVMFDDESIVIQIRVEPREGNRLLIVGAWEGDTSVRTSLEQLDGEDSPRTRWVRWSRLAAGELEIRAYVFGPGKGQLGMDRRPLIVKSRWGSDEAIF